MFKVFQLLYQIVRFVFSVAWKTAARTMPEPATAGPKTDPDAPSAESLREGHELSDARPVLVVTMAGVLFGVILITMTAVGWMKGHLDGHRPAPMPVELSMQDFQNGPDARTAIEDDWKIIDTRTHQHLDGYGWADATHTVVRIPIQRAMQLTAKEGLPARPGLAPPSFPPPDLEKLPLTDLETQHNPTQYGPN
jgi:hypothetical protein